MPDVIRVTAVLNPTSALPQDQVTMSVHFDPVGDADADDLTHALNTFERFFVVAVGADVPVMNDIAKSIADEGHQLRAYVYDLVTGERATYEGAPPDAIAGMSFAARGGETVGLPNETAIRVTLRNLTEITVPLARRTGGIYFGPIEGANLVEGANGFAVPTAAIIARLANAMERVGEEANDGVGLMDLVVWSRPFAGRPLTERPGRAPLPALPARPGDTYKVNQIRVDDEFDTIRRRGRRAGVVTTRVVD